jgi:hypothetical protein
METRRLTARQRRADTVFVSEDPFTNIVRLERSTWEDHISLKHPEVAGRELEVKSLIESPDRVFLGRYDDTAVFENAALRAAVQYDTTTFFRGGTSGEVVTGKVNTVYPNDPHGHPNVRQLIFPSEKG